MFFGIAKAISRQHAVLPEHEKLILDFSDVPTLGVSSSLAIEKMVIDAHKINRTVYIVGATGSVRARLEKLGILDAVGAEHVFEDRKAALEAAA